MYKWGETSIKRLNGVDENLVKCATRALSKSSYDMTIPWMGGLRTDEDQHKIYLTGASQKDGFKNKSYHQTGKALDITPVGLSNNDLAKMVSAKIPYSKEINHFAQLMFSEWQLITEENNSIKGTLEWGGLWEDFRDVPHWQVKYR